MQYCGHNYLNYKTENTNLGGRAGLIVPKLPSLIIREEVVTWSSAIPSPWFPP